MGEEINLHIIVYAEGWNILIGGLKANQGVANSMQELAVLGIGESQLMV